MRASHADREQVVEVLKDAFAQGRLDSGELDWRTGQAFASRTYAELAALTADIPPAPPRQPARARKRAPMSKDAKGAAIGLVIGLSIVAALLFSGLFMWALVLVPVAPFVLLLPVVLLVQRQQARSRGQLPPQPRQGGQVPEVQRPDQAPEIRRPGQVGHDQAPSPDRPDQTRTDARTDRSASGRRGRPQPRQPEPRLGRLRQARGVRPGFSV